MSLADLGNALNGLQSNPMFTTGLGIMAASGPSLMPHSLGQSMASGLQLADQMQMKQAQANMLRAQYARFAWQNAMLQNALGGQQQGASASQSPAVSAPSAGAPGAQPQNGSQGQIGAQAQGVSSAPPSQGTSMPSNGVLGSILGTRAGLASFAMNPEGTLNFALSREYGTPTPEMTNLQAAMSYPQGSAARQLLMGQVMKSGAITTRNGALLPNGTFFQTPNLPDGVILKDPTNPSAGVILPPGMTQAAAAMAASNAYPKEAARAAYAYPIANAQETARAQYTPETVIGPNGVPQLVSRAAAIGAGAAGHPLQAEYTPEQESQGHTFGEQNAKQFQETQDQAQAAQMTSLGYQQAMADAKTFQTGRFADVKGKALAVLNGLGVKVNPNELGSYQDMSKILTASAMQTARTMGSREAAQIVNSIVKTASPNSGLSPEGFAQVVSFMQAPAYSKQAEAQAMQAWKDHGHDLANFKSAWNQSDFPAQILFDRLNPQQKNDFMKANPEAVKQLRTAYNTAYYNGWVPLLQQYQQGGH